MKETKGSSMIGDWIEDHSELLVEILIGAGLLVLAGIGISKFISNNEDTINYFKDEDNIL